MANTPLYRSRIIVPLVWIAAVAMLLISEGAYWQSSRALDELIRIDRETGVQVQPAQAVPAAENEQQTIIYTALTVARVGVAALTLMALVALLMYLRQARALAETEERAKNAEQAVRLRLESEVISRTAELTDLTRYLLNAREDERSRLARNLHDDLGALLTSAKMDAARIRPRLANATPETLELLAHLVGTLNSSVALGRDIIENLRPSTLSNLGLTETLDILAREFSENSGIKVLCTLESVTVTDAGGLMVYRVVQEALTNISKYAQAGQVWISLSTLGGQVQIVVRDDGIGFNTGVKPVSAYGLVGMRFRVEAEGGLLTVTSASGQGTRVEARLPQSALSYKAASDAPIAAVAAQTYS